MNKISDVLRSKKEFLENLRQIAEDEGLDLDELAANVASQMMTMKDRAKAKVGEVASEINDTARKNPWPFIAGAAIAGFCASFVLKIKQ